MSATMTGTAPAATAPGQKAGLGHLLLSELTKIRSVRSTVWSLIAYVVVTVGLTALLTWLTVHAIDGGQQAPSSVTGDPASFILGTGLSFGQLAIVVLGALTMTTEYSTGVIRASVLAVPKRLRILAAKCIVFAALIFVVTEIISFASFFIGRAIISSVMQVSLSDPGVTRAVIGTGLYLTVLGLFALAIGALIRHSAGAITVSIGLVLVVGPLLALLNSYSWGRDLHSWFPTVAGSAIVSVLQPAHQVLTPWQGFAVFCGWTALLLIIGGLLLRRRDA